MELSQEQIRFFNLFGYLVLPELFAPEEMLWITENFEISIQRFGGGQEHDGKRRTMFGGPIEHTEKMCTLLDDSRITGLLTGILGADFNYCSGDGNYYSGDTGWHPDGNWGQLFAVKIAFYLDPVAKDTGCLRVLPGSQKPEHFVRSEKVNMNRSQELFGVAPRDFPGNVPLESKPGDLVVFNHDLYHAAFGGSSRRRMFTMNCTRHGTTSDTLELCHKYLGVHTPGAGNVDTGAGMYYPMMVQTASESRWRHLRQPAEIHDALFPQFARKLEP